MGRALARARRGRGAPPRRGAVHRRPRARPARLACGDRPLAARPRAGDGRPTAALALDGVRGVLTGDDVARPRGRSGRHRVAGPLRRRGRDRAVRRRALAVVVARDRYVAEDAAELVAVDYEPLEPVSTCSRRRRSTTAPSTTATSTRRSRGPTSSSARRSACRGSRACRRVLRRRLRLGRGGRTADRVGELPGAVHAPRRRRRGARPARRPAPAPDAARLGGSFGIKAAVLPYVVLLGLASRALGVPVRWTRTGSSTSPRAPRPGA